MGISEKPPFLLNYKKYKYFHFSISKRDLGGYIFFCYTAFSILKKVEKNHKKVNFFWKVTVFRNLLILKLRDRSGIWVPRSFKTRCDLTFTHRPPLIGKNKNFEKKNKNRKKRKNKNLAIFLVVFDANVTFFSFVLKMN